MSGEYMEIEDEYRTVTREDGSVGIIPSLNSVMRSCDADGVVDMEHTMNPSGDGVNYEYAPRGTMARVIEYQQRIETLNRIAADEMVLRATCETQAKMLRNAETDMRRMHERIDILETLGAAQTEYTEQLERDYTAARAWSAAWKQAATCRYRAWGTMPTKSMIETMARLVGEKAALKQRIDAMLVKIESIRMEYMDDEDNDIPTVEISRYGLSKLLDSIKYAGGGQ